MFLIRQSQVDVHSTSMLTEFETRMVVHLHTYFPEWTAEQGPDRLAEFVRYGIKRAQRYDFTVELDLARYLHVMQALGKNFDESKTYPWAPTLLTSKLPPSEKMDRLRDATDYYIEARRIQDAR